jgi:hypothetical protein
MRMSAKIVPMEPAPVQQKPGEILVFFVRRDTKCGECGNDLLSGTMITLERSEAHSVFAVPISIIWSSWRVVMLRSPVGRLNILNSEQWFCSGVVPGNGMSGRVFSWKPRRLRRLRPNVWRMLTGENDRLNVGREDG